MSDQEYQGFRFRFANPDATAAGGVTVRHLYVVARGEAEALATVGALPGAEFTGSGPEVLARARALGVKNGGYALLG